MAAGRPMNRSMAQARTRKPRPVEAAIPLHKTAKSDREVEGDNLEDAAEGVFAVDGFLDLLPHLLRGPRVWAADIGLFCTLEAFFVEHVA